MLGGDEARALKRTDDERLKWVSASKLYSFPAFER